MTSMVERCRKRLTETLAHHGVTLHPYDVVGLVQDVLMEINTPTPAMLRAGQIEMMARNPDLDNSKDPCVNMAWQAMIDAALKDTGA